MHILGISCYYHDAAAAILKDGLLVAAAEEERFSRIKHDFAFPSQAITFCLEQAGIEARDLDYVVFYEKPFRKFERILNSVLASYPQSYLVFREAMISWLNDKLWVKAHLLDTLGIPSDKLLFVEHHLAHAASAFFSSPYHEAAILTVDGVGEWTTTTIGHATADWGAASQERKTNQIELSEELLFPHSLGLLYSAFTAFLGFRVNEGEYKVMGMAPYGQPTRMEDVHKVVRVAADGSFELDMDYFSFHRSTKRTFNRKFEMLFGSPRQPESEFYTNTTHPNQDHPEWQAALAKENQAYADIAASIQRVTEEIILGLARAAREKGGSTRLCMAGGVALNSVANGRIQRELDFDGIYIQPAAGDSGGALGAALYAYHVLLGQPRQFVMEHAYWGKEYSQGEIQSALQHSGRRAQRIGDTDKLAATMVDDLLAGKVIALYQGRFEWGPRALGNRSILADPRTAEMKGIVNERIKFREPFRPFAPVLPEREVPRFYDGVDDASRIYSLRYMLMVYPTKAGMGDSIQAVTHEGGTGRIQTVRPEWNPLYYRVVELFGEATGIPVLLNTSFNLRGEPIVTTPANALNTFGASDIDTLYMDGQVVRK